MFRKTGSLRAKRGAGLPAAWLLGGHSKNRDDGLLSRGGISIGLDRQGGNCRFRWLWTGNKGSFSRVSSRGRRVLLHRQTFGGHPVMAAGPLLRQPGEFYGSASTCRGQRTGQGRGELRSRWSPSGRPATRWASGLCCAAPGSSLARRGWPRARLERHAVDRFRRRRSCRRRRCSPAGGRSAGPCCGGSPWGREAPHWYVGGAAPAVSRHGRGSTCSTPPVCETVLTIHLGGTKPPPFDPARPSGPRPHRGCPSLRPVLPVSPGVPADSTENRTCPPAGESAPRPRPTKHATKPLRRPVGRRVRPEPGDPLLHRALGAWVFHVLWWVGRAAPDERGGGQKTCRSSSRSAAKLRRGTEYFHFVSQGGRSCCCSPSRVNRLMEQARRNARGVLLLRPRGRALAGSGVGRGRTPRAGLPSRRGADQGSTRTSARR